MESIALEIKSIEVEENEDLVDQTKLFGSPVIPLDFEEKYLNEDDFFVGQINLAQIRYFNSPLPKDGMLYFFLEVDKYPYKAKVIYSREELRMVLDDFNSDFTEFDAKKVIYLDPQKGYGDIQLLGDLEENEIDGYDIEGYQILLQIDSLSSPDFPNLGAIDGFYYFLIKKEDLAKKNFSKVLFIAYGS